MKNLSRILLITLFAVFVQTSFANGIYLFTQFGRIYHNDLPNITNTTRNTIDKFGYRFGIGYNVTQTPAYDIGVKLGYGYYGKTIWTDPATQNQTFSHTLNGYDLQAVATYHTEQKIDFIIHGGLVVMQDKIIANNVQNDKSHTKPIIGAGIAWNFEPNLAATFDYDHVFGDTVSESNFDRQPTMNVYWLGLRYKFKSFQQDQQ